MVDCSFALIAQISEDTIEPFFLSEKLISKHVRELLGWTWI